MKNLSMCVALGTLCLSSMVFCSCKKSNEDLLKDYQEVSEEMVSAIEYGQLDEAKKLSEKGEKIDKELRERDLTDSEQEEKAEIEAELMKALSELSPF